MYPRAIPFRTLGRLLLGCWLLVPILAVTAAEETPQPPRLQFAILALHEPAAAAVKADVDAVVAVQKFYADGHGQAEEQARRVASGRPPLLPLEKPTPALSLEPVQIAALVLPRVTVTDLLLQQVLEAEAKKAVNPAAADPGFPGYAWFRLGSRDARILDLDAGAEADASRNAIWKQAAAARQKGQPFLPQEGPGRRWLLFSREGALVSGADRRPVEYFVLGKREAPGKVVTGKALQQVVSLDGETPGLRLQLHEAGAKRLDEFVQGYRPLLEVPFKPPVGDPVKVTVNRTLTVVVDGETAGILTLSGEATKEGFRFYGIDGGSIRLSGRYATKDVAALVEKVNAAKKHDSLLKDM